MTFLFNAFATVVAWLSSLRSVLSISGITGFLTAIYAGVAALFVKFVALSSAFRILKVTFAISILTAFYLAIENLIAAVSVLVPDFVSVAAGWVLPSNTTLLLSSILTAIGLRSLYDAKSAVLNNV